MQQIENVQLLLLLLRVVSLQWHHDDLQITLRYFYDLLQQLQPPVNVIVLEELQSLALFLSQKSIEQPRHCPVLATVLPFRFLCIQTADGEDIHPRFLSLFFKSCVLSKSYSVGNRFMESRKWSIKLEENTVDPCDVLLTFYYAAIIYLGVKDYGKALQSLNRLFSVPSNVISDVAVDAYKKYVLVSLMVKDSVEPLAKFSGLFIQRQLKNYCQEYLVLAKEFEQRDIGKLVQVMENYRPVFQRDMHWGLVKETFKALLRSNMKNLTRTFLTLSLEDVATKANLKDSQEAERLLRSMVYRGEISAVIDQRAQMVSFALGSLEEEKGASSSNKKNTWNPTMLAESRRCIDLFHQLTQFYQNLSMDPQYMYREQDVEEVLDHSFC